MCTLTAPASLSLRSWAGFCLVAWLAAQLLVMAPTVALAFAVAFAGIVVAIVDGPRS